MGMSIAEKILAAKSGRETVIPGDVVTVHLDTVILFDNNFVPSNWRDIQRVCDPERIVVVFDHRVPAPLAPLTPRSPPTPPAMSYPCAPSTSPPFASDTG